MKLIFIRQNKRILLLCPLLHFSLSRFLSFSLVLSLSLSFFLSLSLLFSLSGSLSIFLYLCPLSPHPCTTISPSITLSLSAASNKLKKAMKALISKSLFIFLTCFFHSNFPLLVNISHSSSNSKQMVFQLTFSISAYD